MGDIKDVLLATIADASPKERASLVRAGFRMAAAVMALWAIGAFAGFGFPGFARADDVAKITEAKEREFVSELNKINSRLDDHETLLKKIRIDQLGAKLRDLKRICCSTSVADEAAHARLTSEIEATQYEYKTLAGERYPLPDHCEASDK